jgi:hypothetical protein
MRTAPFFSKQVHDLADHCKVGLSFERDHDASLGPIGGLSDRDGLRFAFFLVGVGRSRLRERYHLFAFFAWHELSQELSGPHSLV